MKIGMHEPIIIRATSHTLTEAPIHYLAGFDHLFFSLN